SRDWSSDVCSSDLAVILPDCAPTQQGGICVLNGPGLRSNKRLIEQRLTERGADSMAAPGQQFSTKDRILGAAEELFAQHGFSGTSLRQVTALADVNIAAVNYHFGSKDNLVHEVFRRRMDVMSRQRLDRLRAALEARPGELEPILAA